MGRFTLFAALGAALVGISSAQPGSVGCFADDRLDRVLTAKWSSSEMTPTVCADYCRDQSSSYTHYATQYGRECWCQDESIDFRRHGAATCDYQCSGDDSIVCGGFDAFSLYDLEEGELPSPPTDDNYVGCFADDRNDRVLGAKSSSSEMTSEACASYCADESPRNTYYATQWGHECWCAAEVHLRHGDGTCDMACTGDAGTTCGGFDAFDLFELGPLSPSEDHYLGCFADDKSDRVLGDKMSSGDMSLQLCEDYCTAMDKPFFALQWGQECWCGGCDLLDEGHRFDRHGTTSCTDHPCTGEASRDCGAYDAFSLFYRGTCEEGPTIEPSFAPTGSPTSYPTLDPTITVTPTSTPTSAPTADDTTSARTTSAPTTSAVPTNSSLEFVSTVRMEVGDDITILGCSDSWIYVESLTSPTIQPDELLLIMNGQEGVSYSDTLVDSCECFPLMRKIVGIEASQEHSGISCSGSSCWILTSELLTPLDTVSVTDVDDLGLADLQDVPWESLVGSLCVPSETNGRRLLGECRDAWEGSPCPYNDCPDGKCYECSSNPSGCDNGCGPADWPSAVTRIIAELTPFGNGCCNHDYCWSARPEDKDGCDLEFWGDNLVGCWTAFGLLADTNPKPLAACNIVGTAFYLAVALGGDDAHEEAVEKQRAWEETCQATPAPSPTPEPKRGGSADGDPHLRVYDGTGYDCHGQGEFVLTKAAATESEVQARFQQWSQNPNPAVTVTTGIAAREGTSSLIQVTTAASGGVEVLVDGELYDASATSVIGVALEVTSSRVEISFESGLDVFVSTSINGMLRVNAYAPVSLATTGLLGNNNGVLGDDFTTVDEETVGFATASPTVEEGTNYCTTNWCTTADASLFTYAEGEDHGTFDLCDAVYAAPVLPDAIPASITELCGDNADCIIDALLAGEEVGQATLEGQAEDRAYQEEVAGLCASNSFSSTGAPPCTTCPDGEVSGTGATACIRQELVGLSLPENIAAAMAADATGGFAGPGSLTTTPAGTIQLTEEDGGSVSLSGTFVRDDGAALPSSTTVFIYTENTAQPDDFVRGQEALDPSTGAFSTVVTDIPAGSSRLLLSFVVVDPAEALDTAGADTAFALDVSNSACVPSLTITLEWTGETSDVDLYVVEPGEEVVYFGNRFGDVGFLDNDDTFGFGPENYIIDSGLDPAASQVLGDYETYVKLYSGDAATETWRLTARVSGEVAWIEEGDFISSTQSDTFVVSLSDYDPTCGGVP